MVLQQVATDEDKIHIYEVYQNGKISEHVAEIILGEDLTTLQADTDKFRDAAEEDSSQRAQKMVASSPDSYAY